MAMALAGLVLAGWEAGHLRAQVSTPDPSGQVELNVQRVLVADTQDGLKILAEEQGSEPRRPTQPSRGQGTIRGSVTAAATGAPVRGATVRAVFGSGDAPPVTTVTNDNGAFELRGLAAGSWQVSATKTGFVPREFGQRSPAGRGSFVSVTDRRAADANIALLRGGAVTGRVFDEFGEPAVGVRVQAMQFTPTVDGRRIVPAGTPDISDDTGAFRVYGLMPGDYLVSARAPTPFDSHTFIMGERVVFAPASTPLSARFLEMPRPVGSGRAPAATYFPGTSDLSAANAVSIGAGEERNGIDFALTRSQPARVSGRVVRSSGDSPAGPVMVSLSTDSLDLNATFAMNSVQASGTFDFRDVPPGSYVLTATAPGGGRPEMAELPLRVTEDITGLEIVTAPGVALGGTVVSDGGTLPALRGTIVRATPVSGRRVAFSATSGAVIDGAFTVPNLLGAFRLAVQGVPAGWILKAIEIDGADVTDAIVTFAPGQRPNATVVLTNRITELSGTVTKDRNPIDADVAIFPDDPARWTSPRFVRTLRASDAGAFSLRGLPPHDHYLAVASEYLDESELRNPEFLEQLRLRATSFALEAGESRRISLPFVERSAIDGR
jgi:hypothetical protein